MKKRAARVAGRQAKSSATGPDPAGINNTSRRSFIQGSASFLAGAVVTGTVGIATSYFSEVAKATFPPTELADDQARDLPVRAVALQERSDGDQGELWYFPYAISSRPDVAKRITTGSFINEFDRRKFYYDNGAADIEVSHVKLVLEGRRNDDVRVLDIRARATKSAFPSTGGTLLIPGPQGRGASARMGFDFDRAGVDLPALAMDSGSFKDEYFSGNEAQSIGLARGEQQVIEITASTAKSYVEWSIDLVVLVDGARFVQNVIAGSRPVRTALLRRGQPTGKSGYYEAAYEEIYEYSAFSGVAETGPARSFVRKK